MSRLLFALFAAFLMCLSACGFSLGERAVAEANRAIEAVREASDVVAARIHELPDRELQTSDFGELRTALGGYMGSVETLNAALRELGSHYASLQPYLQQTFRPASEAALSVCQSASDALAAEASSPEDFRRALTRIGLCLDRYATAVTNVSAEYERVSR